MPIRYSFCPTIELKGLSHLLIITVNFAMIKPLFRQRSKNRVYSTIVTEPFRTINAALNRTHDGQTDNAVMLLRKSSRFIVKPMREVKKPFFTVNMNACVAVTIRHLIFFWQVKSRMPFSTHGHPFYWRHLLGKKCPITIEKKGKCAGDIAKRLSSKPCPRHQRNFYVTQI